MAPTPQLVKLRSQRGAPPYFAGRTKELALLNERLGDLLETGDATEGMALIVGVPGVGKTQLAREFAKRATQRDGKPAVRQLLIDTNELKSDVDLFLAIGHALDEEGTFRAAAELDAKTTGGGGSLGPLRGNVTRDVVRHTAGLTALLRKTKNADAWAGKSLVVVVDELQTVDAAGMVNLRVLHEGAHGCPLLLLGVGLQHTSAVLANAGGAPGISRLALTIQLRPLSEADTFDAIRGGMQALGHEIPAPCARALAKASQGFPQHIHGYLAAALEAIRQHGCFDEGESLTSALAAGRKAAVDYYDDRLRLLRGIEPMKALVRIMARRRTRSLPIEGAVRALEEAGFDGQGAIDKAVAHGVLAESSVGAVSFGIPSFHGHMSELSAGYLPPRITSR